ncbi:MAG: hypothetical protein BAJALOKI3v1_70079 [Promethearchaeota archaeon]|nr:MAG: hypothetical protein BAJALOKI3v1_70079 [Candidatus Lokiarchaeota archaeon]
MLIYPLSSISYASTPTLKIFLSKKVEHIIVIQIKLKMKVLKILKTHKKL